MSTRRRPLSARRADRRARRGDDGMAMVMCMIFVILGMLVITPLLGYASSVLHTSRIQTEKTNRAEAVRGALRIAMADPKALYDTCSNSGLHSEVTLANPGLDVGVHTVCTTVLSSAELDDTELRTAITTTQVGSAAPVGAIGSQFAGNGGADTAAWYSGATTDSAGGAVWLPRLPSHALNHPANSGYLMPAWAGTCRVYFPGTYTAPIVVNDTVPTYFTSGVYYFESTVTFSGAANVVIGEGAAEGCTDDQDAAYNAINAPSNHNISGLGATFVFGGAGRLIITDTGATSQGPRVSFNARLVDPTDVGAAPSKGVSIISVNGVTAGSDASTDLNLVGQLQVPKSTLGSPAGADAATGDYLPSTLVPSIDPMVIVNPIVDISYATAAASTVFIPGYIAVPQGRINIAVAPAMSAGKDVQLVGGVLTALFSQTIDQPATLQIGFINRIVQKTFKLVGVTTEGNPQVTSVAIVQINDYGEFAVNSWVTASAGSAPS